MRQIEILRWRKPCLLWLAALTLCCCQGTPGTDPDEWTDNLPPHGAVPLRISGANAGGIVTRATDGRTELTDGGVIGLFLRESENYIAIRNRQFTYATPFWAAADGQVLLSEKLATLAAYYPFREVQANPLELRCQAYNTSDDLYYYHFQANKTDASVVLNMNRIYALIRFRWRAQTGSDAYMGDGTITAFGFRASGVVPRAEFDLFTGQFLSAEGVDNYPFVFACPTDMKLGTTAKPTDIPYLMVPAALTGEIVITATIDGKSIATNVSAQRLCGVTRKLVAGTRYDIELVMEPTGVKIGNVVAENWQDKTVGGDAGYETQ